MEELKTLKDIRVVANSIRTEVYNRVPEIGEIPITKEELNG